MKRIEENDVSLKELVLALIEAERRANDNRFAAQEKAIETSEHNRDIAINKAEASIEKKSDIAYVKISDLQKALSEVMLRPEVESRFKTVTDRIDDLKTSRDTNAGSGQGKIQMWGYVAGAIGLIIAIIGLASRFL